MHYHGLDIIYAQNNFEFNNSKNQAKIKYILTVVFMLLLLLVS